MMSIEAPQIQEILSLYQKYGWTLRRVLLTDSLRERISDQLENLFGAETVFVSSEIDALWFSRSSLDGGETWEIRHLSNAPFALVEVFDEREDEEVRDERLAEMQSELGAKISAKTETAQKSH